MAPRLKVFVTSDGLTDFVVAASSKPKALAAWGSHQDLFKTGLARETDDAELVKAATAQPGEVLRRPAGTRGELARLKPAKAPRAKPPAPSKAALRKVAELEKRLAVSEAGFERAEKALQERRARLDEELAELDRRRRTDLRRLQDQLSEARRALG
jgi:hypothetical protein